MCLNSYRRKLKLGKKLTQTKQCYELSNFFIKKQSYTLLKKLSVLTRIHGFKTEKMLQLLNKKSS